MPPKLPKPYAPLPALYNVPNLAGAFWFDIPEMEKQILLLSTFHEQSDGSCVVSPEGGGWSFSDPCQYINALPNTVPCFDITIEYENQFNDYRRVLPPTQVAKGTLNAVIPYFTSTHLYNLNQAALPGAPLVPARYHYGDGRSLYTKGKKHFPVQYLFHHHFSYNLIPQFDTDDWLALYYGIGSKATKNGNPNDDVKKRYKKSLKYFETESSYSPFIPGAMPMSLTNFAHHRRRLRKTLLAFMKQFPKLHMTTILESFRATLRLASRGTAGGPQLMVEAFADIYAFLRMFRTFDITGERHSRMRTPCDTGYQHRVLYLSQIGHSMNMLCLFKTMFDLDPTFQTNGIQLKDSKQSTAATIKRVIKDAIKGNYPTQYVSSYRHVKSLSPLFPDHPHVFFDNSNRQYPHGFKVMRRKKIHRL